MQRHYHIHLLHPIKRGNIPHEKLQLIIAILICQFLAMEDHIFFQVKTNHADIKPLPNFQKIIHGKSKIGLAASEINQSQLSVLVQLRKDIFYKFQETIDLTEFIIPCMHDLSLFCHDSKIHQKRHRCSFFYYVAFLSVMLQDPCFSFLYCHFFLNSSFSFFTHHCLNTLRRGIQLQLLIITQKPFFGLNKQFFFLVIFVIFSLPIRNCCLKIKSSL